MLRHWFRTKRQLSATLDAALQSRQRLQGQIDMLNAENNDLDQRLTDATRARNRAWQQLADLGALTADDEKHLGPLGQLQEPRSLQARLQQEKARADALEERLHEMQQKSVALDRPA